MFCQILEFAFRTALWPTEKGLPLRWTVNNSEKTDCPFHICSQALVVRFKPKWVREMTNVVVSCYCR